MVDLAVVAVVVGGAFQKVVDAFVTQVVTSVLEPALKAAKVHSLAAWPAGQVIVALINVLVIAFVVFLVVRALEAVKRKEEIVKEDKPDPQVMLASAATRLSDALDRRGL